MKRLLVALPLFFFALLGSRLEPVLADSVLNLHSGFNYVADDLAIVCYSNTASREQSLSSALPFGYGTGVASKVNLALPSMIRVGTVSITGKLFDNYNNPVGNSQIVFSGALTGTLFTNVDGVISGSLTASKAQTAPLNATVNGKTIFVGDSNGKLLPSVIVLPAQAANLVAGLPSSSLSSTMGWGLYYDTSTGQQMAAGSSSGYGQYIQVDLLQLYTISTITVNGWNSSYGASDLKAFRVDYLDTGTNTWKTAYTGTMSNVSYSIKYTFNSIQARYVKVYATSPGYSGNQVWLKYFVG